MSWDELQGDENGWSVGQCSDEMKTVEKNLLKLNDMWEEMGWDEKSWDEVRRAHMIWDKMKCRVRSASVKCKCEVWSVQCEVWGKVFAWRCIAPGSCAGHVLGQHLRNSFAQSTHARAWLVHGACNSIDEKGFFSISRRQLPPRLVRVLLVSDQKCHNSLMSFANKAQKWRRTKNISDGRQLSSNLLNVGKKIFTYSHVTWP